MSELDTRRQFVAEAQSRIEEFEKTGLGIPWLEMKRWLEARSRGERPSLPTARSIPSGE